MFVLNHTLTPAIIKAMPKIDLHRHLEGSLRLKTLLEIAQKFDMDVPYTNLEALRPHVQITNDPPNHDAFLSKFHVLRHFYRTPETVSRLVYEVVADAALDNVKYLELRFSPQALSRVRGFPITDVTDWVIDAVQQASHDYKIVVGLIVTLVRHDPIEQAYQVAKVAMDRKYKGIVALDLAGDEVRYPPEPFTPLFKEAKEEGLGITIHAGEWASARGVELALNELFADRIGHGIRTMENSKILRLVLERKPAFEVCLTSNVQSGVVHQLAHHPLVDMLDLGLNATINTDDPTVSDSVLSDEYEIAVNTLGLGYKALRHSILTSAQAAFLPKNGRKQLITYFENALPENGSPTTTPPTLSMHV